MIPRRISRATANFGPPRDWNEERDGKCVHLWVRMEGNVVESAWEPTPDELAALNAGASVILSVVGGQPPVALYVEPAGEER